MHDANDSRLSKLAIDVVARLKKHGQRIVIAESCTGGLIGATLATVPGVSDWFCGSAVTYRESTKTQWLGLDAELLKQFTAESAEVTIAMANCVLTKTDEAGIALAITGHLGPGAPAEKDGAIFVATTMFSSKESQSYQTTLSSLSRAARQIEATEFALQVILKQLN